MSLQEWIVVLIGLVCVFEIVRRTIRFFRSSNDDTNNPCASCASGCDIKRMFDEKQQQCKSQQRKPDKIKKPNKKHCG